MKVSTINIDIVAVDTRWNAAGVMDVACDDIDTTLVAWNSMRRYYLFARATSLRVSSVS